jgi:pimeloyl-ACP methyl ester carboxylesterase
MRPLRSRAIICGSLLLISLSLLTGCAAPLVSAVDRREIDLSDWPAGTEVIETKTEDGAKLRGLQIPGQDAEPIILHFLPRAAATTVGIPPFDGFHESFLALRDEGYGSIIFDYRGVGASAGSVDSLALPRDARAMWTRAVEIAGGDASRVILRGASLGSLAVTAILETGARPAAVVLAAPIDADSVVAHAARDRYGAIFGGLASAFGRGPDLRGLEATLRDLDLPALVVYSENDPLLPRDSMLAIRQSASRQVRFDAREAAHEALVLRFFGFEMDQFSGRVVHTLDASEAEFLRGL